MYLLWSLYYISNIPEQQWHVLKVVTRTPRQIVIHGKAGKLQMYTWHACNVAVNYMYMPDTYFKPVKLGNLKYAATQKKKY